MAEFELTWEQIRKAGLVALDRMMFQLQNDVGNRYGMTYDGFGLDEGFVGCLGELTMSLYLGADWRAYEIGAIDVGHVEVRSCNLPVKRLIVHEEDRDHTPFVSVLVRRDKLPIVYLRGWLYGADAKRKEWWKDPTTKNRWAFFPPNDALRPMDELPSPLQVVFRHMRGVTA